MNVHDALTELGRWTLLQQRETFGDIDSGSVQDKAKELGLLIEVPVTEPCGEDCTCAEYGEFPQVCLRLADEVQP